MENPSFSEFKLRVNINAPVQTVYDAWATPAGLESWFLRKAAFADPDGSKRSGNSALQTGDKYEWFWHGYPDSVVEHGKVLEADGRNRFVFTFSLGCPVTIRVFEELGETMVELVESELPTDPENLMNHFVGDSRGWIFYLANLKSVLEGGLDLRNRREEIKDVITA